MCVFNMQEGEREEGGREEGGEREGGGRMEEGGRLSTLTECKYI